jgi:hypothetical protein
MEAIQTGVSVATLLTVVIGGLWAYYRFVRRREHAVRLGFKVDVKFVGVQDNFWLVSLDAQVDNEGFVRHDIRRFGFDVRYLNRDDSIVTSPELGGQVDIRRKLVQGSWLPQNWSSTFLEPGARTVYSFVSRIPTDASFVLLHGLLDCGEQATHSAEMLCVVPRSPNAANPR